MSSSLAREETQGAFERLYRSHRSDVYRFVLRDVRNPDEAEDVTQTAFLNAYRALQHGDRPEKPRAWLLTIAQNVARRRFRTRSSRPQEVELDPELVVAPEPDGPSANEIREALRRLRPNHRTAIVLREIGGLSYAEIAETLGLSVSAVETLLFRARRALREELTAGDQGQALRLGGLVLPLPAALSKAFGSLAAWVGRRAVTVQVAGALGAAAVGVGVAVETGALAQPGSDSGASSGQAASVAADSARDVPKARPVPVRHERRKSAKRGEAASLSGSPGKDVTAAGGSLLGVQVPELSLPDVGLPSVPLPAPPEVPPLPLPEVEPPPLPVPEVEPPPLPDANDLLP
jgi:RNA polymerase sigma-70 factor, ECF subfamily